MEQITFDTIKIALLVILALAGAIATVDKAVDAIKKWRKPRLDIDESIKMLLNENQKKLDNDKRRLDAHEIEIKDTQEMSRAMCKALNALLMHGITGNSVTNLRAAKDGLDAYLLRTEGDM